MKHLLNWKKFNESILGFGNLDEISLGSCPKNETSIQAHVNQEYPIDHEAEIDDNDDMDLSADEPKTDPEYLPKQKEECERYADMLEKRFVVCNAVNLYAKREGYEGSEGYYDVIVKYDADDTEQKMQAHFIEDNLPDTWSDDRVFTHDEYKVWYDDNLDLVTYSEFE